MSTHTKQAGLRSFQELLDRVGGTNKLALDLNVHRFTVDRWGKNGFPEKYILPIAQKYGFEISELRRLSKRIKAARRKSHADARIAVLANPL